MMSHLRKMRRREGFTLIELMIVVAIIGILAAIAIPNFLRFQLRSKAGEGKINLEAIRTAEESYFAETNVYSAAVLTPVLGAAPLNVVGSRKLPWGADVVACTPAAPAPPTDFCLIGWVPEGDTYFQYQVTGGTGPGAGPALTHYTAEAQADIDNDTSLELMGYVSTTPATAANPLGVSIAGALGCVATGTWDLSVAPPTQTGLNVVGTCTSGSGFTVF